MNYNPKLTADFVAGFEGFSPSIYKDPVGVETIGFGETDPSVIDRYRGKQITIEEARVLLGNRLEGFANQVTALITVVLNENQLTALTSWAYNVGTGAVKESTLRTILNQGDYAGVRAQLMRWTKAGGKDLPGLVTRRKKEADLFEISVPNETMLTYGWREIHRFAREKLGSKAADPTPAQSYSGTHAVGSYHKKDSAYPGGDDGCAVDYGNANSDCEAVFDLFKQYVHGPIEELIWKHVIIKFGVPSYYSPNDHMDHVHVGIGPTLRLPTQTQEDWLMALTPAQQENLYAMTEASNKALARLEIAVRDPNSGLIIRDSFSLFKRAKTQAWYQTNGVQAAWISAPAVVDYFRRAGVPVLSDENDGAIEEDVFNSFIIVRPEV